MAFLDLTNVRKSFATSTAVENFNLEVERGEFISFLGPSGCGKTTTLRMIAGFETPSSGTIEINGVDVTNTPPNRRHVGMVPAEPRLNDRQRALIVRLRLGVFALLLINES